MWLSPLNNVLVRSMLANEEMLARPTGPRRSWAGTLTLGFLWALLALSLLLTYAQSSEALLACCGVPRLDVLTRLLGWLWGAQRTGCVIVLALTAWWISLLVLFASGLAFPLRASLLGALPLAAYLVRETDAAVVGLVALELAVHTMLELALPK